MCSSDNIIYHNNFLFNQQSEGLDVSIPGLWVYPEGFVPGVGNIWDNGKEGNYWSEYENRYSNASKIANTNIYDTPYYINEYNIDNYPLIASFKDEGNHELSSNEDAAKPPESLTLLLASFLFFSVLLVVTLLAYNKKRKHRHLKNDENFYFGTDCFFNCEHHLHALLALKFLMRKQLRIFGAPKSHCQRHLQVVRLL
jgi:hypothetical protein